MEILALIMRVILIIAGGIDAISATMRVASDSGIDFDILWDFLPSKWK